MIVAAIFAILFAAQPPPVKTLSFPTASGQVQVSFTGTYELWPTIKFVAQGRTWTMENPLEKDWFSYSKCGIVDAGARPIVWLLEGDEGNAYFSNVVLYRFTGRRWERLPFVQVPSDYTTDGKELSYSDRRAFRTARGKLFFVDFEYNTDFARGDMQRYYAGAIAIKKNKAVLVSHFETRRRYFHIETALRELRRWKFGQEIVCLPLNCADDIWASRRAMDSRRESTYSQAVDHILNCYGGESWPHDAFERQWPRSRALQLLRRRDLVDTQVAAIYTYCALKSNHNDSDVRSLVYATCGSNPRDSIDVHATSVELLPEALYEIYCRTGSALAFKYLATLPLDCAEPGDGQAYCLCDICYANPAFIARYLRGRYGTVARALRINTEQIKCPVLHALAYCFAESRERRKLLARVRTFSSPDCRFLERILLRIKPIQRPI